MGYFFTDGATRKDIIAELTKPESRKQPDGTFTVSRKTLRHCTAGNVLWTVESVKREDMQEPRTFIGCYILMPHKDGWGYKPMDESVGPHYYSCPLKYLELAPTRNLVWRLCVRMYWDERNAKREAMVNTAKASRKRRKVV